MKLHFPFISAVLLVAPVLLYAAAPKSATAVRPASAAAAATAAPALPKSPVPEFKRADTDHDGKIGWAEAKAVGVPEKIFKQDDFDKNGDLNETEWMFVRLDMTDFDAPAPATGG